MVVVVSLAAAVLFGLGASLQRHGVVNVTGTAHLSLTTMKDLLREPKWLAGTLAGVLGALLQLDALDHGNLLVVTPLLSTGLIFALVADSYVTKARLSRVAWVMSVVVAASMAGVVLSIGTASGGSPLQAGLIVGFVASFVLSAALWFLPGRHQRPPWIMGGAAGIDVAFAAALAKAALNVPPHTVLVSLVLHALKSWPLYAAGVMSVVGTILFQHAYNSGPLAASLPVSTVVQPIVGIVAGILVFKEHFGAGPGRAAEAAVAFAVTIGALWLLSRQLSLSANVPSSKPSAKDPSQDEGSSWSC
jgi:drug/metabolite transporter (DMT)-like permease